MLTIALSKGKILDETLPLLAKMGITPQENPSHSRRLILTTNRPELQLIIIRATDVPTYVEYGAADLGIAGKDILMEQQRTGLYEPLDLGISRCQMMIAGRVNTIIQRPRARIATKYPHITRKWYAQRGEQVEIIKLYGSMELAPLVGLADYIVDLVDTGNTLRANGLVPLESIAEISARLIVNQAALKLKYSAIKIFIHEISSILNIP